MLKLSTTLQKNTLEKLKTKIFKSFKKKNVQNWL
jgi:hypothetical protein